MSLVVWDIIQVHKTQEKFTTFQYGAFDTTSKSTYAWDTANKLQYIEVISAQAWD